MEPNKMKLGFQKTLIHIYTSILDWHFFPEIHSSSEGMMGPIGRSQTSDLGLDNQLDFPVNKAVLTILKCRRHPWYMKMKYVYKFMIYVWSSYL